MNVDVGVDGRAWRVTVEVLDERGRFAVTINGTRRLIDASWIDADTLSLVDGAMAREIRLHRRDNGEVGVEVDGRLYSATATVSSGRSRDARSHGPDTKSAAGPTTVAIKAPMPGRVVRVLVAVGERVTARQGLVVVEAMKMENELRAPRDGTVREVRVAPGAAVERGAVLVEIG